ncbi:MAG: FAD-binding oxidoreductase [Acidobacteriota bacterium]
MDLNVFTELKEEASKNRGDCRFRVVLRGEYEYDAAREISNSYVDRLPAAVAFPRTARHVQKCIQFCIDRNKFFRLRSGGHQHEGMSSLDDGLMIRLSEMCLIEFDDSSEEEAWIDTGMKLGQVYTELHRRGQIIPGGGCFTVNVGGLTQGGGWGLHARKHGLTCDSVRAVEVVLYDHETGRTAVETITPEHRSELLRALRGGGGGNFGVVTRFKFRLAEIPKELVVFRLGWRADQAETVAKVWLEVQDRFPDELTSFVRMGVMENGAPSAADPQARDFPIYAGGLFYGSAEELWKLPAMREFLERTKPAQIDTPIEQGLHPGVSPNGEDKTLEPPDLFGYDDFTPASIAPRSDSFCDVAPPSVNCDRPHPHKVSSAFPTGEGEEFRDQIATAVADYLNQSRHDPNVRSYMTFHAMGGAISRAPSESSCFAYRDKAFLLQFQSWWNKARDSSCEKVMKERQERAIEWVRDFRETLNRKGLVEGAFINFVDKNLPVESTACAEKRLELLRYYYADELPFLRGVKREVDPSDVFKFEMSIPPA